jgi:hypothetical protein
VAVSKLVIDRHVISFQVEFQRRVDALPSTEAHLVGPAYHVAAHALDAIRAVGGDAGKVDWPAMERAAAIESLSYKQNSAQEVLDELLTHSPGAVTAERRAALKIMIKELVTTPAPAVEDKSAQLKDHGRDRDDDTRPGW